MHVFDLIYEVLFLTCVRTDYVNKLEHNKLELFINRSRIFFSIQTESANYFYVLSYIIIVLQSFLNL